MILGSSTDTVQPKVSRQGKRKEGMEDLKSHRCDQCGYSAKYAGRVREHRRRVHEKVKQFKCREVTELISHDLIFDFLPHYQIQT